MRIIAGSLGGRNFIAPKGHKTRPMSEKVRGALFNALGDIEGLTVLDAFSGSGAIGFEALSRGAKQVTAIDSDKDAQLSICQNITSLGVGEKMQLISASTNVWLRTSKDVFDIVICDPPYNNFQTTVLVKLAERTKAHGTLTLSLPPWADVNLGNGFRLLSRKAYGDASLLFYRRLGGREQSRESTV